MTVLTATHADAIAVADARIDSGIEAIIALREAHLSIVDGVIASQEAVTDSVADNADSEVILRKIQEAYRLAHKVRGLEGALQDAHRLVIGFAELACDQVEQVEKRALAERPEVGWF